jgi:hypothetical protein
MYTPPQQENVPQSSFNELESGTLFVPAQEGSYATQEYVVRYVVKDVPN